MSSSEQGGNGDPENERGALNRKEMGRFERAIEVSENDMSLLFIIAPPGHVSNAVEAARSSLPSDREAVVIDMSVLPDRLKIYTALTNAVGAWRETHSESEPLPVFLLAGLDEFLGGNSQQHRDARVGFNQLRDRIAEQIQTPLVFVVTSQQLKAFRTAMPDFYSIFQGMFEVR